MDGPVNTFEVKPSISQLPTTPKSTHFVNGKPKSSMILSEELPTSLSNSPNDSSSTHVDHTSTSTHTHTEIPSEDVLCNVCNNGECEEGNYIVLCDGCDKGVHQACYGISVIPEGKWFCAVCSSLTKESTEQTSSPSSSPHSTSETHTHSPNSSYTPTEGTSTHSLVPVCKLCGHEGGIMRKGQEKIWVHSSCVLFAPSGPYFRKESELDEPMGLRAALKEAKMRNYRCVLCNYTGYPLPCSYPRCNKRSHLVCAREHGSHCAIQPIYKIENGKRIEGVWKSLFCPDHSNPTDIEFALNHEQNLLTNSAHPTHNTPSEGSNKRPNKRSLPPTPPQKPAFKPPTAVLSPRLMAQASTHSLPTPINLHLPSSTHTSTSSTLTQSHNKSQTATHVKFMNATQRRNIATTPPSMNSQTRTHTLSQGYSADSLDLEDAGTATNTQIHAAPTRGVRVNWVKYENWFKRIPIGQFSQQYLSTISPSLRKSTMEEAKQIEAILNAHTPPNSIEELSKPLENELEVIRELLNIMQTQKDVPTPNGELHTDLLGLSLKCPHLNGVDKTADDENTPNNKRIKLTHDEYCTTQTEKFELSPEQPNQSNHPHDPSYTSPNIKDVPTHMNETYTKDTHTKSDSLDAHTPLAKPLNLLIDFGVSAIWANFQQNTYSNETSLEKEKKLLEAFVDECGSIDNVWENLRKFLPTNSQRVNLKLLRYYELSFYLLQWLSKKHEKLVDSDTHSKNDTPIHTFSLKSIAPFITHTHTTPPQINAYNYIQLGGYQWHIHPRLPTHMTPKFQIPEKLFSEIDFVDIQSLFFLNYAHSCTQELSSMRSNLLDKLLDENTKPLRISDLTHTLNERQLKYSAVSRWSNLCTSVMSGHTDKKDIASTPTPAPPVTNTHNKENTTSTQETPNEEITQSYCSVCFSDEHTHLNPIITCCRCHMSVHKGCYAIGKAGEELDASEWMCKRCEYEKKFLGTQWQATFRPGSIRCIVCGQSGGAFKRTKCNYWAHLLCVLWHMPDCVCEDLYQLEPWDVSGLQEWKRRVHCSLCGIDWGYCVKCSHPNCKNTFHPMCAWQQGLYVRASKDKFEYLNWNGKRDSCFPHLKIEHYCSTHTPIEVIHRSRLLQMELRQKINVNRDNNPDVYASLKDKKDKKKPIKNGRFKGRETTISSKNIIDDVESVCIEIPDQYRPNMCTVCLSGDVHEEDNLLLHCLKCSLCVHRHCYGARPECIPHTHTSTDSEKPTDTHPPQPFICDVCLWGYDPLQIHCKLCPRKGGALKLCLSGSHHQQNYTPISKRYFKPPQLQDLYSPTSTDDLATHTHTLTNNIPQPHRFMKKPLFSHMTCCLWSPHIHIADNDEMSPIRGVETVPKLYRVCEVCKLSYGYCLECSQKGCTKTFHPLCAQLKGYFMEMSDDPTHGFHSMAFCEEHSQIRIKISPSVRLFMKMRAYLELALILLDEMRKRERVKHGWLRKRKELLNKLYPLFNTHSLSQIKNKQITSHTSDLILEPMYNPLHTQDMNLSDELIHTQAYNQEDLNMENDESNIHIKLNGVNPPPEKKRKITYNTPDTQENINSQTIHTHDHSTVHTPIDPMASSHMSHYTHEIDPNISSEFNHAPSSSLVNLLNSPNTSSRLINSQFKCPAILQADTHTPQGVPTECKGVNEEPNHHTHLITPEINQHTPNTHPNSSQKSSPTYRHTKAVWGGQSDVTNEVLHTSDNTHASIEEPFEFNLLLPPSAYPSTSPSDTHNPLDISDTPDLLHTKNTTCTSPTSYNISNSTSTHLQSTHSPSTHYISESPHHTHLPPTHHISEPSQHTHISQTPSTHYISDNTNTSIHDIHSPPSIQDIHNSSPLHDNHNASIQDVHTHNTSNILNPTYTPLITPNPTHTTLNSPNHTHDTHNLSPPPHTPQTTHTPIETREQGTHQDIQIPPTSKLASIAMSKRRKSDQFVATYLTDDELKLLVERTCHDFPESFKRGRGRPSRKMKVCWLLQSGDRASAEEYAKNSNRTFEEILDISVDTHKNTQKVDPTHRSPTYSPDGNNIPSFSIPNHTVPPNFNFPNYNTHPHTPNMTNTHHQLLRNNDTKPPFTINTSMPPTHPMNANSSLDDLHMGKVKINTMTPTLNFRPPKFILNTNFTHIPDPRTNFNYPNVLNLPYNTNNHPFMMPINNSSLNILDINNGNNSNNNNALHISNNHTHKQQHTINHGNNASNSLHISNNHTQHPSTPNYTHDTPNLNNEIGGVNSLSPPSYFSPNFQFTPRHPMNYHTSVNRLPNNILRQYIPSSANTHNSYPYMKNFPMNYSMGGDTHNPNNTHIPYLIEDELNKIHPINTEGVQNQFCTLQPNFLSQANLMNDSTKPSEGNG